MTIQFGKVLFTRADCDALIQLSCDLTLRGRGRSSRVIQLIADTKRLLRAESACVFESRGGAGSLREVYRDGWRDWHSDALSSELSGMPVPKATEHPIQMTWLEPESTKKNRPLHALASCHAAGSDYLITLAYARRAQPFTEREVALVRVVQRSELMALISPTRAPSAPELTKRMRQVLSRLMEGDSEKQIATHLTLSRHTVHQYVKSIYRRYAVNSRGELLSLCVDPIAKQRVL